MDNITGGQVILNVALASQDDNIAWALFVWGYALGWFLFNDHLKLLAYRIFDPI